MATEEWSDKEWKQFETKLETAETQRQVNDLLDTTRTQTEHPEWYESPCLCQLCCSYGD